MRLWNIVFIFVGCFFFAYCVHNQTLFGDESPASPKVESFLSDEINPVSIIRTSMNEENRVPTDEKGQSSRLDSSGTVVRSDSADDWLIDRRSPVQEASFALVSPSSFSLTWLLVFGLVVGLCTLGLYIFSVWTRRCE